MTGRLFVLLALALMALLTLPVLAGCEQNKKGVMNPDQHSRIQKGMTLDDVEAIAGTPERTHKKGSARDPNIIWYYSKTESEGLVRVSFQGGKVDSITPYDTSIAPEE